MTVKKLKKLKGTAAGEHRSAFKRVHVDDTGSDHEISSEEDESFQTVGRPQSSPRKHRSTQSLMNHGN